MIMEFWYCFTIEDMSWSYIYLQLWFAWQDIMASGRCLYTYILTYIHSLHLVKGWVPIHTCIHIHHYIIFDDDGNYFCHVTWLFNSQPPLKDKKCEWMQGDTIHTHLLTIKIVNGFFVDIWMAYLHLKK